MLATELIVPSSGFSQLLTDVTMISLHVSPDLGWFMHWSPSSAWIMSSLDQGSSRKLRKHLANMYHIELAFVFIKIILRVIRKKLKTTETKLRINRKFLFLFIIFLVVLCLHCCMQVRASLVVQTVKNLPAMWETQVQSLGGEDPLGKGMATHSSILA